MKTRTLIIIGIIMMSTIPFVTFAILDRYSNYVEQINYITENKSNEPKPGERSYIEPELKAKLEVVELDLREKVRQLHQGLPPSSYAVNLDHQTKEIVVLVENKDLIPKIEEMITQYPDDISILIINGKITLDEFLQDKVEPNAIIIYDVTENSGTRLSIAPHDIVMDLKDGDTVTFVNDGLTTVNIFDNSKGLWRFDNVKPSSQRTLVINSTGFYEFLIQNSLHGQQGRIVALSDDTNSLPVETRAKMAQTIVGSDFGKEVGLIFVGSGRAEPGITIGIDEKFQDKHDDAEKFYYEKYRKMIPFEVPITIEFSTPIVPTG
jgi:hypothetical protein